MRRDDATRRRGARTRRRARPQTYGDTARSRRRAIFATADAAPRRLSDLLGDARETEDPEILELVWLGSLWAFAPDTADDPDADLIFRIAELTGDLVAEDDGSALSDTTFAGADLLIGKADAVAALREPPAQRLDDEAPVSLDAYRAKR